ncbi:MAG: hypothetical protein GXP60_01805 [Epsilonproteobacteria bacterium]|nr:hypothetical protein [Campylobacterota bacterium]
MNDIVIALYENDEWSFYNKKLTKIALEFVYNRKLYVVLPDHFFYFFQTDILAKRNTKKTVRAYTKTIFPEETGFIDYIPNPNGAIGYIVSEDIKNIKRPEILKNAVFITTPLLIQYANIKSSFVYTGKTVSAAFDGKKLACYIKGSYEDVKHRLGDIRKYKQADADMMHNIGDLISLIHERRHKAIRLSVEDKTTDFNLAKSAPVIAAAAIIVILIISGQIFRYEGTRKDLSSIENRIDLIYKKAFNGKKYRDPYGMLLYEAKQCEIQQGIKPMNLVYALSKAKKPDTKIKSIVYDKKRFKIKGDAANYDSMLGYLNALNKILHINAKVKSTKSRNGKLEFGLIYNAR